MLVLKICFDAAATKAAKAAVHLTVNRVSIEYLIYKKKYCQTNVQSAMDKATKNIVSYRGIQFAVVITR